MSDTNHKRTFPENISACHALIEQLTCTVEELQQEKAELHMKLAEALRMAFAKRRERYIEDPDQLKLDFGDNDDAADAAAGLAEAVEESEQTIPEHTRRRRQRRAPPSSSPHTSRVTKSKWKPKTM